MNNLKICLISVLLIVYQLSDLSLAKIIEADLETKENWIFLSSFCFLDEDGVFQYDIAYPKSYESLNLLLYFDDQWAGVYKNESLTCEDKHKVLDNQNNQIITLTEFNKQMKSTHASGCKLYNETNDNNNLWYRCTHYRKFHSKKERTWYFVIDNCESQKGLKLRYNITMINQGNQTCSQMSTNTEIE